MAIDTEELNKNVDLANNSIQLLSKIATAANQSVNHMLLVIRWNQMELALLRTLESVTKENLGWMEEGQNEIRALILQLDDFREQLATQQQAALDRAEGKEDSNVGSQH